MSDGSSSPDSKNCCNIDVSLVKSDTSPISMEIGGAIFRTSRLCVPQNLKHTDIPNGTFKFYNSAWRTCSDEDISILNSALLSTDSTCNNEKSFASNVTSQTPVFQILCRFFPGHPLMPHAASSVSSGHLASLRGHPVTVEFNRNVTSEKYSKLLNNTNDQVLNNEEKEAYTCNRVNLYNERKKHKTLASNSHSTDDFNNTEYNDKSNKTSFSTNDSKMETIPLLKNPLSHSLSTDTELTGSPIVLTRSSSSTSSHSEAVTTESVPAVTSHSTGPFQDISINSLNEKSYIPVFNSLCYEKLHSSLSRTLCHTDSASPTNNMSSNNNSLPTHLHPCNARDVSVPCKPCPSLRVTFEFSAGLCVLRRQRHTLRSFPKTQFYSPSTKQNVFPPVDTGNQEKTDGGHLSDLWEALVIRRNDDHFYEVPKGHLERGESLEAGAERELREETGLLNTVKIGAPLISEIYTVKTIERKRIEKTVHYFSAELGHYKASCNAQTKQDEVWSTDTVLLEDTAEDSVLEFNCWNFPEAAWFGNREGETQQVKWMSMQEAKTAFWKSNTVRTVVISALEKKHNILVSHNI